jgi:NADH-quinone oxidoreductase subunit N
VFYLFAYTVMNLAAFAVIVARERESPLGDDIASLYGLGAERPWLAWPMTIAMLGLAGLPATVGFFGKLYLIEAAVDNEYGWLGAVIVIGSAISLVYYLRVIAAVWMRSPSEAPAARAAVPGAGARPAIAGGSGEAGAVAASEQPVGRRVDQLEVIAVALVGAAATVVFGIYPDPLFELARDAGAALTSLV